MKLQKANFLLLNLVFIHSNFITFIHSNVAYHFCNGAKLPTFSLPSASSSRPTNKLENDKQHYYV